MPASASTRRTATAGQQRELIGRLGTDTIDLYYTHRRDLRVPIVETAGAMAELVQAVRVRQPGLSGVAAEKLREASSVHPVAAVQSDWSRWSREVEHNGVPAAVEPGVGLVPCSPLGRGFLTGTVDAATLGSNDFRRTIPRFAGNAGEANHGMIAAVQAVTAELEATPAQAALASLLVRVRMPGLSVVAIPGTRKAPRIDENPGAPDQARLHRRAPRKAGRRCTLSSARGPRTPGGRPRDVNNRAANQRCANKATVD